MAGENEKRRETGQAERKVSRMILECAGDFIAVADTPEQRRSRLNAACSAWNIACNHSRRDAAVDQYMREYQRVNPDATEQDLADVRSDMEKLIQKKLEMFPEELRQIVGAEIVRKGDKDHISIASAPLK